MTAIGHKRLVAATSNSPLSGRSASYLRCPLVQRHCHFCQLPNFPISVMMAANQPGRSVSQPANRDTKNRDDDKQRTGAKMNLGFSTGMKWAAIFAAAATLMAGCGKKVDAISQSEKKDVAEGKAAPSIAE